MNKVNNICYCKCHEMGKGACGKCKTLHIAKEKAATHENDISNPNYTVAKK